MTEMAGRTLLLPFIPSPYPDEVLGSWLSRIRLENGGGAWRAFLEHIGYGRRLQTTLFDSVDHNEKLSAMLTFLGTTYERVLLELTTLPYWLTFSASDSSARLPGTATIPALRRKTGADGEIASIRALGSQRTLRKSFAPRYCPKCISQDREEKGQSYWHRAHQLPNVFFCHRHHCELQVACPKCGAKPSGQNSKVLPLPPLKCRCGFRLDQPTDSRIPSAQELRLIDISVRAVCRGVPGWHRDNVLRFMKSQLAESTPSTTGRYQSVLEEAFPAPTMKWSDCGEVPEDEPQLRLRRYLSQGSAPECCALLVALDVNFDVAIVGFIAAARDEEDCIYLPDTKSEVMTVANSRAALIRAHKLYPDRSIAAVRGHYWNLRLNDSIWLQEHFPRNRKAPIPTIFEDRSELIEILSSVPPSRNNAQTLARVSAAGLRATLRDKKWFDEQKTQTRQKNANKRADTYDFVLSKRAKALQVALDKILSSEERPIRIFASTLGALVGLSEIQAALTIKSVPELREALANANSDKLRRQLLWASRQLNLSGGRLSKKQLGRVAGVPTAAVSDEIFAEIKSLHFCKTESRWQNDSFT